MKKAILIVGSILIVVFGVVLYRFRVGPIGEIRDTASKVVKNVGSGITGANKEPVGYVVEEVARGLFVPWSIVFTSKDRMVFTERNGRLRVYENSELKETPLHVFNEVSTQSEEGLMGLAMHPDYQKNKYLYLSLAYESEGKLWVKVVRVVDDGSSVSMDKLILDKIPAGQYHAGSRVKFGPDGKLYVTTGDATEKTLAQKMDSLAGKILRLNDDGSIPSDNPFPGSPVYSLGHRNPQGIAWDPITKNLYSTEHGPSGFDGPGGGDEFNLIKAGANYGWPVVSHEKSAEGMIDPALVWTPAIAPASGMFYEGDLFPQFKNNFFFGGLRGTGIYKITLEPTGAKWEKLGGIDVGRVREVVEGPNGEIYFSSSNKDERGILKTGDDKIYRLVAK